MAWYCCIIADIRDTYGRLGMSGGISPRHAQNPLSGERRKTLSITHHALSPPPSHHHLYIIHLINWLQRFYRIIMSLKRPFVPKSDVKQWFTTTTTWHLNIRICYYIKWDISNIIEGCFAYNNVLYQACYSMEIWYCNIRIRCHVNIIMSL